MLLGSGLKVSNTSFAVRIVLVNLDCLINTRLEEGDCRGET